MLQTRNGKIQVLRVVDTGCKRARWLWAIRQWKAGLFGLRSLGSKGGPRSGSIPESLGLRGNNLQGQRGAFNVRCDVSLGEIWSDKGSRGWGWGGTRVQTSRSDDLWPTDRLSDLILDTSLSLMPAPVKREEGERWCEWHGTAHLTSSSIYRETILVRDMKHFLMTWKTQYRCRLHWVVCYCFHILVGTLKKSEQN